VRTLEDLVREMLQPMLRSWLDDNLPTWSSCPFRKFYPT